MLSIAILHFNHDKLTNDCLRSVLTQEIPYPHEIIIVDNGSENLYPARKEAKLIRLARNRGITGGINACFEFSKYDWVLFISNDFNKLLLASSPSPSHISDIPFKR